MTSWAWTFEGRDYLDSIPRQQLLQSEGYTKRRPHVEKPPIQPSIDHVRRRRRELVEDARESGDQPRSEHPGRNGDD